MQIIQPDQYRCAFSVVDACHLHGHMAFAYAVLELRQPGRVYIDDPGQPRSVLVCNDSGFFLAFGRPDKADGIQLIQRLCREPLVEENSLVFGTSKEWDGVLAEIFAGQESVRLRRLGFEHRPSPGRPPADWIERLPDGSRIEPIDARIAQSILDGSGTGAFGIDPWFIRIAGGPEGYASAGLGLALMFGDQIASLCGYCGLGHGEAELEIGTVPAYQGKGLATLVSAGFLEQCRRSGWRPVYTCDSDNRASISVAHKLGFHPVEEITGYRLLPLEAD